MIMERPVLSKDFTIEDIHRLREYNYERTRGMSRQERIDFYNGSGMSVHRQIQAQRDLRT